MMLQNQPSMSLACGRREALERGAGIGFTLLLHLLLLAVLLHARVQQPVETRMAQQETVINAQLIPQALVQPAVASAPPVKRVHKHKPAPPKPPAKERDEARQVEQAPPVPATVVEASAVVPSPPRPTSAGVAEPLPLAYLTRVMMTIGLQRRYPLKALANREQGTVVVHIHLARDGTVLDAEVIRSSGYPILDAEARDVVFRIARFPPLPDEYARGAPDFAIDQPIRFSGY